MPTHPCANRLIYAADMSFAKELSINKMISLARSELDTICAAFDGLGITIKGNTIFRVLGATAFYQLDEAGCNVFGDYKLFDVQSTCNNEGSWLQNVPNLDILTVDIGVHPKVFTSLVNTLPNTIIAPVGPLTDLGDEEFAARGQTDRKTAVTHFFKRVTKLPSTGVISSPKDLALAPEGFRMGRILISPGIRPLFARVKNDTNAINALTPAKAIYAGVDKMVIGGPIRHNGKLRSNAIRILDETQEALG